LVKNPLNKSEKTTDDESITGGTHLNQIVNLQFIRASNSKHKKIEFGVEFKTDLK
jgi:hypothetical protein